MMEGMFLEHLQTNELQMVKDIARIKSLHVRLTSSCPDISMVSLVWMKKAVQWVCDGIPSNSYVKHLSVYSQ